MHMQTVIVEAPRSFVDGILRPELQELSSALLTAYLAEITEKLIRKRFTARCGKPRESINQDARSDVGMTESNGDWAPRRLCGIMIEARGRR